MPNCDFYALAPDLVGVLDFIFAQPGWSLIELGSEPDRPLREFHSTREVRDACPSSDALDRAPLFHLYAASMGGRVNPHRIDFRPGAFPGFPSATHRYSSEGWGLIQLYFGTIRDGKLSPCHTNHNSQKRAEKWEPGYKDRLGPVAAWDWREVTRTSGRLVRFIRGVAPAKIGSRPILLAAHEAYAASTLQLSPN